MAIGAMLSVQLGVALSTPLFDQVGATGTAWLRLSWAALIFLLIARPRVRSMSRRTLAATGVLGLATGAMTLCFMLAIDRIPLGTASAIEFLGPLTVAVVRSHHLRNIVWPVLAAIGVVGLTEPWAGSTDPVGVGFALLAALCWATYIVLTQHVGDRVSGLQGLAISMPVAAVAAAFVGVPAAVGHLDLRVVLISAGLALLLPVLPFALELAALRRLSTATFGTLMSIEPAIALLIGMLVLHQAAAPWQLLGIVLVVTAGVGAERAGARSARTPDAPLGCA